ncbi:hypothetical protein HanIR_Chr14g0709551 [Helianthus annuus]|nr:hypothetical protein HanIR_Chr14g0709551 [Helianthus annuus]
MSILFKKNNYIYWIFLKHVPLEIMAHVRWSSPHTLITTTDSLVGTQIKEQQPFLFCCKKMTFFVLARYPRDL